MRAVGNQPNKRVSGKQPHGPPHRRLDELQLLLDNASVDHEEKDRRRRRGGGVVGGGGLVLDGGELGVKLAGDVGLRDGGVVMGEVVAREAEGADPDLGGEVDAAVRVDHGGARGFASERGVR